MALRWNSTVTGLILPTDLINQGEYPSIDAMLEAIGDATAMVVVTNEVLIRNTLTSPCNVAYTFSRTGRLLVNSGVVFTIDGSISAGAYPIFAGLGTIRLNGDATPLVFPQWFGTSCGGQYTNTEVTAATNSIYTGTSVIFQAGDFSTSVSAPLSSLRASGFVTINGTDTEAIVTLTGLQIESNTNYRILLTTEPQAGAPGVSAWVKDGTKTINGFTIQISGAPGSAKSVVVNWVIVR